MELEDNYGLLQDNTISILKNYPRFLTLLKVIANRLDNLQDCVNYLCENMSIETAEGIWLDYLAWLVGTTREAYNILNFFCVNAPHLNVEKLFYFEGITPDAKGNLQDFDDNFYIEPMTLIKYKLLHLENVDILSSQYKAGVMLSFLDDDV